LRICSSVMPCNGSRGWEAGDVMALTSMRIQIGLQDDMTAFLIDPLIAVMFAEQLDQLRAAQVPW
jgi:hypothetical protein